MTRGPLLVLVLTCSMTPLLRSAPDGGVVLSNKFDLEQALSFALDNNFAIRQARERLREQEGVVTTVSATALPTVSVSGSFQKSEVSSFQLSTAQNPTAPVIVPSGRYWRMNFTVRQTLYGGGGIRAAMASAGFTRDAAILELQAIINETLLAVRTRFYAGLLAREQITVQEQNLQLLESQLRDVTIRLKAGTISDFERLRAEVAVANAKVPLIKARNDHRLAVEELRQVLGLGTMDNGQAAEFVGALVFAPVDFDLLEALQTARANRPELKRLTKLVAAAEAGEQSAHAGLYPTLILTGGGDLRKGPSENFSDSLRGLRAGVQAQENVNLRVTTGRVRQAESGTELARLEAGAMELAVQVEVRQAVSTLEQAAELVAVSRKSVEQAEEAVRIATVRFKAGVSPQLDLLQSQVELTKARTNQFQAVYAHNIAGARLRKAMGQSDLEYADGSRAR